MDQSKPWYMSTGVWGGIVAAGAGVIGLISGHTVSADDQAQIANGLARAAEAAASIVSVAGGIVAIYGRVIATKKIGA